MERPWIPAVEYEIVYATQLPATVLNLAGQSKPSWLIADGNDRMVPPQYEQDIAKQIHATLAILASGYVPMPSIPFALRPRSSTRRIPRRSRGRR